MCKYYIPIHKRVDEELKKREARKREIVDQVNKEKERKDKIESDELYFPRTKLSYEIQKKRKNVNKEHQDNEDLYFMPQAESSHQQFMNFLRDHQAWEYRKDK